MDTYTKYAAKNKMKTSMYMYEFQDDNKHEMSKQKLLNIFY